MLLLDITVVNVALPSIREDLGASFTDLQWVIDAYALTLAAFVLTAGSLADRLGRRRVFAAGLVIFSVASLLCALAPDPTMLNLARALQGIGGAVMFAVSLALIAQEFPAGRERGMAMGDLRRHDRGRGGDRAAGRRRAHRLARLGVDLLRQRAGRDRRLRDHLLKLRESRDPNATRIDWAGVGDVQPLALPAGAGAACGATTRAGAARRSSALFAAAAILMAAFIAIELRVSQPMLPLGLFAGSRSPASSWPPSPSRGRCSRSSST